MCPLGNTYTVKQGDTFRSVARALGISEQALAASNPLVDPSRIQPGQVLCAPGSPQPANPQPQPGAQTPGATRSPPTPPQPGTQPPRPVPPQPPQPNPQRPRPAPPQLCPPGFRQATVQAGERLEDLLLRFDVSYRAMRAANPSLSEQPQPGMRFCAPPAGSRGCRTYTLAAGDTLERAAARLRTTPGTLLRLNPAMAPRDFSQGRVICIE